MTTTPLQIGSSNTISFRAQSLSVLPRIRDWARQLVGRPNIDIDLLVTELVTNAIKHGEPGVVIVDIERERDEVIVAVKSPVSPATPWINVRDTPPDPQVLGGRGLQIASAVATELRIEQSDDTVEVVAHIPVTTTS